MDAAQIVIGMVNRDCGMAVILEFLRECIREPRKAADTHSQFKVLPLHEAREICFGSGLPLSVAVRVPMHSDGL